MVNSNLPEELKNNWATNETVMPPDVNKWAESINKLSDAIPVYSATGDFYNCVYEDNIYKLTPLNFNDNTQNSYPLSYINGMSVEFKIPENNLANCLIKVGDLDNKNIKDIDNTLLKEGKLKQGEYIKLRYDLSQDCFFIASSNSMNSGTQIAVPIITLSNTLGENEIWLEGAEISRTTYAALFEIYGTTYGEGDGSTTFNLPDFRNRTLWGAEDFGYIEAGLPNITGYFTSADDNYLGACGGSFSAEKSVSGGESSGSLVSAKVSFKASLSSSIYGNSNTVQPPSVKVRVKTRYA